MHIGILRHARPFAPDGRAHGRCCRRALHVLLRRASVCCALVRLQRAAQVCDCVGATSERSGVCWALICQYRGIRNSSGAMRTSHGLPHVPQQCLFVLEQNTELLDPVYEPVAQLPLVFLACAHLHHWLPNHASCLVHRLAPCAGSLCFTASCAAASMRSNSAASNNTFFPDGIHAGLQTRRSRVQSATSSSFQYFVPRCEVCVCLVMCPDFGLSLQRPALVRENASVVPVALGLRHHTKTPMP